jgi:hypothetical protein
MSNPTIRIHNTETDEVTNREMTDAEYTAWLDRKAIDDAKAEAQAKAQAKAEADKVAAQAKLAALGLTTDDLKALGL